MPCLRCKKDRVIRKRGDCDSCYTVLNRGVKEGRYTWEALEKMGQCLPAQKKGAALKKTMEKLFRKGRR